VKKDRDEKNIHITADTDSFIVGCSRPDFSSLVKDECKHNYDKIASFLFEDEDSAVEQSSKFKIEGVWRSALFRTTKAYRLDEPVDVAGKNVVRMRSISTKAHKYLEPTMFSQDPRINSKSVRTVSMRPSLAGEINVLRESKSLSHCLNFKRRCLARDLHIFAKKTTIRTNNKRFRDLQDPVHSVSLS
jgi:hypothetical protein